MTNDPRSESSIFLIARTALPGTVWGPPAGAWCGECSPRMVIPGISGPVPSDFVRGLFKPRRKCYRHTRKRRGSGGGLPRPHYAPTYAAVIPPCYSLSTIGRSVQNAVTPIPLAATLSTILKLELGTTELRT